MKVVFSNYNFTPNWIKEYDFDYLVYDRSDSKEYLKDFPQERIIYVENKGTDIYDKFGWIIENYENLPEVVLLSKSNMLKYIAKEEFDKVKDNKTFTPLLTNNHKTYSDSYGEVCFYKDGMYYERNNFWYLNQHKPKSTETAVELIKLLGLIAFPSYLKYLPFAPGSNYIVPRENILKHSKEFYEKLRSYLMWDRYPGEAMIIERGLYLLWR